jgi:hypothetical protein
VYTVAQQSADGFVTIVEIPKRKFMRGDCLLVPKDSISYEDKPVEIVGDEPAAKKAKKSQTDGIAPTRALRSAN